MGSPALPLALLYSPLACLVSSSQKQVSETKAAETHVSPPPPVLIGHAASLTPRRFLPVVRGLAIADDAWGALMGHLEACIHTGGDKLAEGAMGAVRPLPCTPPFPY